MEIYSLASLLGPTEFINSGLLSDCKLYFRFEDTSGTTVTDSSGQGNNGTASRSNINGGATGKFGYCGTFVSSSSDKVTIADNSGLKPTGNFTVGAWVKSSGTTAWSGVFSSWDYLSSKYAGILLGFNDSGKIRIVSAKDSGSTGGVDFQQCTSTTTITDGSWHFVVGTWNGSALRIYVDGILENTVSWSNAPVYKSSNAPRVGCLRDGGADAAYFNGNIDDLFLLNGTALTSSQISTLYGAQAYWRLEGNANDSKGVSNGTATSVSWGTNYGKYGQGGSFDGTNSRIIVSHNNTLAITEGITIAAWVYPTASATSNLVCHGIESANGTRYALKLEASSGSIYPAFRIVGSAGRTVRSNTSLPLNQWYHVAVTCVFGATTPDFYINGVKQTGTTVSDGSASTFTVVNETNNLGIGARGDASEKFGGYLDDIAVFGRILSDSEIFMIASEPSSGMPLFFK